MKVNLTLETNHIKQPITYQFFYQEPKNELSNYHSELKIFGVRYYPYTYSYLCYGVNQISTIHLVELIIVNRNLFKLS